MKKLVKTATESKIKFTLGTDSWKNKGRERRHYNLLLAWWIDRQWVRHRVCLDARVIIPRKVGTRLKIDNKGYKDLLSVGMDEYALGSEDVAAFLADHAPSLRKAIRESNMGVLGCGCHGLQLQPRHVLPAVHAKGFADEEEEEVADENSDSDSSSTHEGHSDTAGEEQEDYISIL